MIASMSTSPQRPHYLRTAPTPNALNGLGSTATMPTYAHLRRLFVMQSLTSGVLPQDWKIGASIISAAHHLSSRIHHSKTVYPPPARTASNLRSFFVKSSRDWNDMPPAAIHLTNPTKFKKKIEAIIL
ncbi:hypothetical protein V5799_025407 [Amblyomma americanum]|uniref:Uncharacterized protein n=1 Tax=Amblyomma americanum TaxID=6943 RepID=A0AAQ4E9C8_AMBAM